MKIKKTNIIDSLLCIILIFSWAIGLYLLFLILSDSDLLFLKKTLKVSCADITAIAKSFTVLLTALGSVLSLLAIFSKKVSLIIRYSEQFIKNKLL